MCRNVGSEILKYLIIECFSSIRLLCQVVCLCSGCLFSSKPVTYPQYMFEQARHRLAKHTRQSAADHQSGVDVLSALRWMGRLFWRRPFTKRPSAPVGVVQRRRPVYIPAGPGSGAPPRWRVPAARRHRWRMRAPTRRQRPAGRRSAPDRPTTRSCSARRLLCSAVCRRYIAIGVSGPSFSTRKND